MKVDLLGAKCLPSSGPMSQAVVPLVGLPAASTQSNAAPPQACTSIPRCRLYQACSALGSLALKKIPPMPVTLLIDASRSSVKLKRSELAIRKANAFDSGPDTNGRDYQARS